MTNLKDVLEKHRLWVNSYGAEGERANLEGTNLTKADLHGADLRGAILKEANLYGADLHGADLYGANLYRANLEGANLEGANLYVANLEGANLAKADLRGANLKGAYLCRAKLEGAALRGAYLEGANVSFTGIKYFILSKDYGYAYKNDKSELMITIGCKSHNIKYWLANYKQIGKKYDYTADEIYEYGLQLKLLEHIFERSGK